MKSSVTFLTLTWSNASSGVTDDLPLALFPILCYKYIPERIFVICCGGFSNLGPSLSYYKDCTTALYLV